MALKAIKIHTFTSHYQDFIHDLKKLNASVYLIECPGYACSHHFYRFLLATHGKQDVCKTYLHHILQVVHVLHSLQLVEYLSLFSIYDVTKWLLNVTVINLNFKLKVIRETAMLKN